MVSVESRSPDESVILTLVSAHMKYSTYYSTPEGSIEFSIYETLTLKEDFKALIYDLSKYGLLATLRKVNDHDIILAVFPEHVQRSKIKGWMPLLFFAITVGVVMYDGFTRAQTVSGRVYISDPWDMAIIYTLSLMGILGIHELGHMVAARIHRLRATWPFFIPGIPGIFISPPTFGAVIFSRGFMINRDTLFDVGVSGPIAGLIVTIIVSIYGAMISPLISIDDARSLAEQARVFPLSPSLLMIFAYFVTGKMISGTVPLMSPVAYAAWLGFLITFLNLLPAWQLDGGHITRAAVGRVWHRKLTYVSIVILAALGHVVMALFILMMSSKVQDVKPLDDISPLSRNRKIVYIISLILAALCAPVRISF